MNNTENLSQQPLIVPTVESQLPNNNSSNKTRNIAIMAVIALLIMGGSIGGYFLGVNKNKTTLPSTLQNVKPTSINNFPTATNPNDNSQIVPTVVKIPFVRNGNIYLYENGQETLIASSTQKSSFEARYDNAYPFLSPDGKYIAYIQFTGSGELGPQGVLKIYNIDTKQTKTTNYKTGYIQWNSFNQLQFQTETYVKASSGDGIDTAQSKTSYVVLDPQSF